MVAISRKIRRAMAAQLDRVNGSNAAELQWELQRQTATIEHLQSEIARLRARLAALEDAADADAPRIINGRPAITAQQAAARVGVSLATVSRYCTTNWWQAVQDEGRWLIYADQALGRKQKA